MRRLLAVFLSLVCVPTPSIAAAPDPVAPNPADPYEAGKRALRDRDFPGALTAFDAALAQSTTDEARWSALLGLALTHELAADPLRASVHYRRFLASSGRSPRAADSDWSSRRVEVAETLTRLETTLAPTHARLELVTVPESAVAFDPAIPNACALAPCTVFVPPGHYRLTLSASDHHPVERTFDATAGNRLPLSVALIPISVAVPPPPESTLAPGAIAALAAGSAAVTFGAVFFGLADSDQSDLRSLSRQPGTDDVLRAYDRTLVRMQDRETVAWAAVATGAVALSVGIIIWLVD